MEERGGGFLADDGDVYGGVDVGECVWWGGGLGWGGAPGRGGGEVLGCGEGCFGDVDAVDVEGEEGGGCGGR